MRMVNCPECNRTIKHYAKGMCNTCYKKPFHKQTKQAKPKPAALTLARQLGVTEAASRCGVSLTMFKWWIKQDEQIPSETRAFMIELLEELKTQQDGSNDEAPVVDEV